MGGVDSPYKSQVEIIDFGNDTATATPKGPLSVTSIWIAAQTGNQN